MNATVRYVEGLQLVGESGSGHAIVMDGDLEVGGSDTGMRPMELLLVAIGGCSGMDVASILRKKQQKFSSLRMNVHGDKTENHPKRLTKINLEFVVAGKDIDEAAVKRAVELSMEKYCSVKATLEHSAEVIFSYRIEEEG